MPSEQDTIYQEWGNKRISELEAELAAARAEAEAAKRELVAHQEIYKYSQNDLAIVTAQLAGAREACKQLREQRDEARLLRERDAAAITIIAAQAAIMSGEDTDRLLTDMTKRAEQAEAERDGMAARLEEALAALRRILTIAQDGELLDPKHTANIVKWLVDAFTSPTAAAALARRERLEGIERAAQRYLDSEYEHPDERANARFMLRHALALAEGREGE